MPIHDLGYRHWTGQRGKELLRWWVIADTGIRLAWKKPWLKRMVLMSWLPVLFWAMGFFVYEKAVQEAPQAAAAAVILLDGYYARGGGELRGLAREVRADPAEARHRVWSMLLLTLFRAPQAILMVLLIGIIAPTLIANDVRSRAFLLYFSRPITPIEYLLGKSAIVWAFILGITCVPALLLYALAVLLSPDLGVILATWDLPFRVLLASAVLVVPTTAVALCFSSLTSESRYAAFAWFAVWALGWVAYAILSTQEAINAAGRPVGKALDRWTLLSPYATLGKVQGWVFGLEKDFADVMPEAMLLAAVTVVALVVLLRRISAPIRV